MKRSLWAGSILFALSGCRPAQGPVAPLGPPPPPQQTPGNDNPAPETTQPAIATDEPPVTGPGQRLPAADAQRREEGLRALDEGRYTEARRIFAELLRRHRSNASLQALVDAAQEAEQQARNGAASVLSRMPARKVAAPPWKYTHRKDAALTETGPAPKLVQVSQKRNRITDDDEWFAQHGLRLPTWEIPNRFRGTEGDLPSQVPPSYGDLPIVRAISHPDHAVLLYGPDYSGGTVVAVIGADGQVRTLLDLEAWRRAPKTAPGDAAFVDQRIHWAQAKDRVLYVASGHNTYAKSSGGATAYITALDLDTGELLWRSEPVVANSLNFLLRDGWILTGYGFTAEPDFVFVLDAKTGKKKAKHKVKSGPDVLLEKDGQLYVRCYDTDYVFDLR